MGERKGQKNAVGICPPRERISKPVLKAREENLT
jgi:hypothetical protein